VLMHKKPLAVPRQNAVRRRKWAGSPARGGLDNSFRLGISISVTADENEMTAKSGVSGIPGALFPTRHLQF
jgi:hypothetical protein